MVWKIDFSVFTLRLKSERGSERQKCHLITSSKILISKLTSSNEGLNHFVEIKSPMAN
jgi:hypothetical protein